MPQENLGPGRAIPDLEQHQPFQDLRCRLGGCQFPREKAYPRSPCRRGSSEMRQERERLILAGPKNLYPWEVMFAVHAGNPRLGGCIAGQRLC